MGRIQEIIEFWFEGVDEEGVPSERCMARWFSGGDAIDAEIRSRFEEDIEKALKGQQASWLNRADGRLAQVLLLDQMTRNVGRGTPRAFAGDTAARAISRNLVDQGADREYRPIDRYFLYLPFEHTEDRSTQVEAVRLYTQLLDDAPPACRPVFEGALDWAVRHQRVINRFGRFPSRNEVLGRSSTPEELTFLAEHPDGF